MKIGIITQETGFGTLKRWAASWVGQDGRTRHVVEGPIIAPEDHDNEQMMGFYKESFARDLGMALIKNPPADP